ncbi:hypothetical protein [Kitasatospora sp. NPDC059817]
MSACGEQLDGDVDAWVEEHLAASPEWAPEQYARIREFLGGGTPAADE